SERDRTTAPPGAVSVSGVQPAMQSILGHGRGDFARPAQQPREGRDPNGRRPTAGSVSESE
ncbi:hypothetical protein, partial [Rhizobium ruizarguesonis]|uniref:hypothetical protein n=1 Tax=Rhizobium ruizarguesonis TaxID=2081791 RepID=UPI0019535D98